MLVHDHGQGYAETVRELYINLLQPCYRETLKITFRSQETLLIITIFTACGTFTESVP